jgi:hypothetical protein
MYPLTPKSDFWSNQNVSPEFIFVQLGQKCFFSTFRLLFRVDWLMASLLPEPEMSSRCQKLKQRVSKNSAERLEYDFFCLQSVWPSCGGKNWLRFQTLLKINNSTNILMVFIKLNQSMYCLSINIIKLVMKIKRRVFILFINTLFHHLRKLLTP